MDMIDEHKLEQWIEILLERILEEHIEPAEGVWDKYIEKSLLIRPKADAERDLLNFPKMTIENGEELWEQISAGHKNIIACNIKVFSLRPLVLRATLLMSKA